VYNFTLEKLILVKNIKYFHMSKEITNYYQKKNHERYAYKTSSPKVQARAVGTTDRPSLLKF
jgi:hypothetical protein